MIRVAAILTCFALAGCGHARTQETRAVALGDEFTLAPAEAVSVKTAEMDIRFVDVSADSRCPHDVACIWAGEVKARLAIQVSEVDSEMEVLEGQSTIVGDYTVTLVRVEPKPVSTARIAPQDYRATLRVAR